MAIVLAIGLIVGATRSGASPTLDQRVQTIARGLKCPVCAGESVADSDTSASTEIEVLIRQKLQAGETPSQIRALLVSDYGPSILLNPPRSGFNLVVWSLPLVVVLAGIVGLWTTFARWRRQSAVVATDEDRELVEQALDDGT
jgi:cytochrome c-type biogenesis protein CcmH